MDRGADNMLAIEENEGQLHHGVWDLLEAGDRTGLNGLPHDHSITLNKGNGRIERRECCAVSDPAFLEYPDSAGDALHSRGGLPLGHGDRGPALNQQPGGVG